MFQTKMSRVLAAVLVVPFMFSVQGCTDEEVLASIAGIAIVGGAVAIGAAAANNNNHHHDDRGRDRRGDHRGHGRGRWDAQFDTVSSNVAALAPFSTEIDATEALNRTSQLADHYGVSFQAAAKMQGALRATVTENNLQPMYDLGLSRSDIETFGQMRMISQDGVHALAQKLEITEAQAQRMLSQLLIDIRLQAADVNSGLWQSCMASGLWKTPEASTCTSVDTAGCSPRAGASFCAAIN